MKRTHSVTKEPKYMKRIKLDNLKNRLYATELQLIFDLVGQYILTHCPMPQDQRHCSDNVSAYMPFSMLLQSMTPQMALDVLHPKAEKHWKAHSLMLEYNIKWRPVNLFREVTSHYYNKSAFLGTISTYANIIYPCAYFAIDVQAQAWRIKHWGEYAFTSLRLSTELFEQYYKRFYVDNALMKRYWSHLTDNLNDAVVPSACLTITGNTLAINYALEYPPNDTNCRRPHIETGWDVYEAANDFEEEPVHEDNCECHLCSTFPLGTNQFPHFLFDTDSDE